VFFVYSTKFFDATSFDIFVRAIFVILPSVSMLAAFYLILTGNPVVSLLCLITIFLLTALILAVLGLEFLALNFLIIYVGAVAILFLFVIMMFNLSNIIITTKKSTFNIKA